MGFVQIKPEDIIGREDLAKKGDPLARAALMRIIQRDPDPSKRSRAGKLVDELASFSAG